MYLADALVGYEVQARWKRTTTPVFTHNSKFNSVYSYNDLARPLGTSGEHALEKPLCCGVVATLLKQDIEIGAVLIDGSPQQIRLAAQRHEHFVQMPCGPGRAARHLDAMREARAKLVYMNRCAPPFLQH